jgi:hypothetical protein
VIPAGRNRLLAALALATMLASIALTAGSAQAAAYRYWSYWQGATGQWVAAQTGPGDHVVTDTDVQGWRFEITTEMPASPPDNAPDFATLCPSLAAKPAAHAMVRVAVVIDAGLAADAPAGQSPPADRIACVTVPSGSTGNQALAAAGAIRSENSLVCAIDGFPQGECGAAVSDAEAAAAAAAGKSEKPNPATPQSDASADEVEAASLDSSSPGLPVLLLSIAAVVAVAGAAVAVSRRRTR